MNKCAVAACFVEVAVGFILVACFSSDFYPQSSSMEVNITALPSDRLPTLHMRTPNALKSRAGTAQST